MIRLRRKNTAWLAVLAVIITLALLAAPVAPAIQFALIALFALAAVASSVEIGKEREDILSALRRAPIRQRVSPQAKEAAERARARGGYNNDSLMMLDVGLIAVQSGYEGMAMRRTRSISKDDDGVRPFVTLNVDESEAERNATIRFEIYNQHGEEQFVHELKAYLREGEMNIMTDHHLPLMGNKNVTGTGDWDLRVYVDGNLAGMHNFMLAPSMTERQRRLAMERGDIEHHESYDYYIVDEVEQEVPPRIQDLIDSGSSSSNRRSSASTSARASRLSQQDTSDTRSNTSSDGNTRSRSRSAASRRRR